MRWLKKWVSKRATERVRSLRKVVRIPLLGVGPLGALALASGFPARLGLTRAQALVSMPGDLVLPTATLKADRVATLPGTPEDVWPLAHDVVATYEDLWGQPLDVVYEEVPNLLVVATNKPSEDAIDASLAIRFNCGADQTGGVSVPKPWSRSGRHTLPQRWGFSERRVRFRSRRKPTTCVDGDN